MDMLIKRHSREQGVVSLFVVLFATLLITVVTVGFIRLMISDQQQATTNDLSQSAYDSAQAGTEDAKRALLQYQTLCPDGQTTQACVNAASLIDSSTCNAALEGGQGLSPVVDGAEINGGEIEVQQTQSSTDSELDQAYTCVLIQLQTNDYRGTLSPGQSAIIPLKGHDAFNSITINWFDSTDSGSAANNTFPIDLDTSGTQPLLTQSVWKSNRPSIMRSQLMQFGSSLNLCDFDAVVSPVNAACPTNNNSSQSDANTLFLYPSTVGGTSGNFLSNIRQSSTDSPLPVACQSNLNAGGYACSMTLNLPAPVGGGNATAFLRLTSLYNGAHYSVVLNNTTFDGVQPEVDSTGRANDLFRRVDSRISLVDTSFAYPDAAVELTGNFCKDFLVTDNTADYKNNCTP
jgi:Tfp pilus assembly protein PilX